MTLHTKVHTHNGDDAFINQTKWQPVRHTFDERREYLCVCVRFMWTNIFNNNFWLLYMGWENRLDVNSSITVSVPHIHHPSMYCKKISTIRTTNIISSYHCLNWFDKWSMIYFTSTTSCPVYVYCICIGNRHW